MGRIHVSLLLAVLTAIAMAPVVATLPGRFSPASAAPQGTAFELDEADFAQLQSWMTSGRYTSRQLTDLYIQRIEAIDRKGPSLTSIAQINPDALAIADALDRERKATGPRGPLHGIPLVVKDNIDTGDRMMTTAGSLALEGSIAKRDAFVIERLRGAGAVILAKTNLSEWANFRSTKSTSGWSGRGGQVRNPYALDRNPCGSSSGTGSAVAANLAAAGVGTETDGSIVCPSAAAALVGIKPTVGRVSRSGIIPIAHSQDTAGPMARTVADAAVLLEALSGRDPSDPATTVASAAMPFDRRSALVDGALKGARIGVARKRYFGYSPATDRLVEGAIARMKELGAVIIDPADIATAAELDDCEFEVLLYEFKTDLNKYLGALPPSAPVRSLAELIAFNQRERGREMPYFGQEILEMAQKKGALTDAAYRRAHTTCRTRARSLGIDATLARFKLDAIVAPTGGPAWPTDLVNGDHFLGASSTPAAVAGYPNVTVPVGEVYGLPVGISFIGPAWSEARLVALAYGFEQATKHRRPPRFLPTADLRLR
jgi:amidase